MADPLIILLLVASPGVAEDVTSAASSAAREALGAAAHVLVETRPEWPADAEALILAGRAHAKAVVELRWAGTTRMQIHAHVAGEAAWIDRTLTFGDVDSPVERGRTTGLTMASMMPLEWRTREQPPPPREQPAPRKPAPSPTEPTETVVFDATGTLALSNQGVAFGGEGTASVFLGRAFGLRVLGGLRAGDVSPADASALNASIGGGIVTRIAHGARWEMGISGEVLALWQSLHRDGDSASRWLAGARTGVEGAWFPAEHVGAVVGIDEEVAFGATRIFVGPDRVATILPFQTAFKAGLRVRF